MFASLKRPHYAWIVVGAIFVTLLVAAGVRSSPSVLIVPLEKSFGWDRATISAAISLNIVLYGLMGPFAAAIMQRFGIRRTVVSALGIIVTGLLLSTLMSAPWQLILTWGLLVGLGTGVVAMVLGATVVNRWFTTNRGLAMGLLSASTASGQLVFLPMLAMVAESEGWQPVILIVAGAAALIVPLIWFVVPERPSDVGVRPFGASENEADDTAASVGNPFARAINTLVMASRHRDFWILFGSFFICGLSTNGLIGTHLIANCLDHGIPEVRAASLLALMGIFDLVGTTASGWLSDRYDNRRLLFWYYGLRGISLLFLPYSGYDLFGLSIFAVFYGLDWIATVPPTTRLTTDVFGKMDAPVVFGWISAGHQLGAGTAALGAGIMRTSFDSYVPAFIIAGIACMIAAVMVQFIAHRGGGAARPATA